MNCIVVSEHTSSYPDPVHFQLGDTLRLGRRDDEYPGWIWVISPSGGEGWAPESIIRVLDRTSGLATEAYTARELDTVVGERLLCRRELNGWLWVENGRGKLGWIPKDSVRIV